MTDLTLYYSARLRRTLSEPGAITPPGAAHYSYSSVARKFIAMLRGRGLSPHELQRPEIYTAPPRGGSGPSVHLMFKPFEEFRLLNGAVDVAHVAWEFERVPRRAEWPVGDERRRNPFADVVRMLGLPRRIWVGCGFTKTVFSRFGVDHVDVVPAPITTPFRGSGGFHHMRRIGAQIGRRRLSRIQAVRLNRAVMRDPAAIAFAENRIEVASLLEEGRTIFTVAINPGDLRKNLPSLLDGFSLAAQRDPSLALVVKLTIDNDHVTLRHVLTDNLPRQYRDAERDFGDISMTNVFLVHEYLREEQMQALFLCADFYLCPTLAEGQNLPLQEAMALGTIPVAPRHTAMIDYLDEDNAVLMDWTFGMAPLSFQRAYGLPGLDVAAIDPASVSRAVGEAAALSPQERRRKQEAAWRTIDTAYSEAAIGARATTLIRRYAT